MAELLPLIVADGADGLIIESRSDCEDQRDRQWVIEALRTTEGLVRYWWDAKSEPLLWIADAVCGVAKEYVLGEKASSMKRLQAAKVVDEPCYRKLP